MTEFIKELIKNIINEINKEGHNITIEEVEIYHPIYSPKRIKAILLNTDISNTALLIFDKKTSTIRIIESIFLPDAAIIDLHNPNSLEQIKQEITKQVKLLNKTMN